MKVTIFGSGGFIGSRVRRCLFAGGIELRCPGRDEVLRDQDLGVVIYCAGLTADFRQHPVACYEAHVGLLSQILADNQYDKLIYLSSTRVYMALGDSPGPLTEDTAIPVLTTAPSDVYNMSKLAGESLVLAAGRGNTVLRLSNVVGKPQEMNSFVGQMISEIEGSGVLTLYSLPASAKDYISVGAVVEVIKNMVANAASGIFNVCNGYNIAHSQWLGHLRTCYDFELEVENNAEILEFPLLSNQRLRAAMDFNPETPAQVFAALQS